MADQTDSCSEFSLVAVFGYLIALSFLVCVFLLWLSPWLSCFLVFLKTAACHLLQSRAVISYVTRVNSRDLRQSFMEYLMSSAGTVMLSQWYIEGCMGVWTTNWMCHCNSPGLRFKNKDKNMTLLLRALCPLVYVKQRKDRINHAPAVAQHSQLYGRRSMSSVSVRCI